MKKKKRVFIVPLPSGSDGERLQAPAGLVCWDKDCNAACTACVEKRFSEIFSASWGCQPNGRNCICRLVCRQGRDARDSLSDLQKLIL